MASPANQQKSIKTKLGTTSGFNDGSERHPVRQWKGRLSVRSFWCLIDFFGENATGEREAPAWEGHERTISIMGPFKKILLERKPIYFSPPTSFVSCIYLRKNSGLFFADKKICLQTKRTVNLRINIFTWKLLFLWERILVGMYVAWIIQHGYSHGYMNIQVLWCPTNTKHQIPVF